jgi:glyoxylase-like metal-dependent hydrolase (beta-lactamase superfamily II)
MTRRSFIRCVALCLFVGALTRSSSAQTPASSAATYEVYALRYATVKQFPVRSLVAGADNDRRMDIAMMVWLLKGGGRNVLVDAGFYRDGFIQRWKPADFVRPSQTIAALGLKPEDITDIIVSHVHWDHMDGIDLFPKAKIWIQAEEYGYYVNEDGTPAHPGIDTVDAGVLAAMRKAGRVSFVDGDAKEVLPGITAYLGGRHTYASQYVGVHTAAGTVVVASDNLYLYENLERHAAIAQTFDAQSNLAAQSRMTTIASDRRLIVPGHDAAVFERFPKPGAGVARIQ